MNALCKANFEEFDLPYYSEIISKKREKQVEEEKTGDEIAFDFMQRAGLKLRIGSDYS